MRGAFVTDFVFVVWFVVFFFPFSSVLEISYFLYTCAFVMKGLHYMNCLHLGKSPKM